MEWIRISGGGYSAAVDVTHGANCVGLRHESLGAVILREPTCGEEEPDNPYLYGMPILFPVNRISGGYFRFEGRDYRFPINEPSTGCHLHGTLHRTPFAVEELASDRVVCSYRSADYHGFPHELELRITYSLSEEGFHHETEVINHSSTNMPVMLGYHTTFNAAFAGSREVLAEVALSREYERDMTTYLPTGAMPEPDAVTRALVDGRFSPFGQPISRHYRAAGEGRMTLTDTARGIRLVYENDADYTHRLIYNGGADEYICMEPQTCAANAPNAPFGREEGGLRWIPPHASKIYVSKIYLEEIKV